MTGLTPTEAAVLAARHVSEFNDAVGAGSFAEFLRLFTDDAVIRFENVPAAGTLEFAGRNAFSQAYVQQPPDDKIDIAGTVAVDGAEIVVPFSWRRDASPGTIRLAYTDGSADALDERLVSAMTVVFGAARTRH